MSDRRKFTSQFKADAVELVLSSGRPIAQVAPEIGVVEGTLGKWVRWKEASTQGNQQGAVDDHRSTFAS